MANKFDEMEMNALSLIVQKEADQLSGLTEDPSILQGIDSMKRGLLNMVEFCQVNTVSLETYVSLKDQM